MTFVLDCSTTMAWCFEDEKCGYGDYILDLLNDASAIAPTIWALEVANVLLVAQRKRRINAAESERFLSRLSALPIRIDEAASVRVWTDIFQLALRLSLSSYDAAYLEIAIRCRVPLATLHDRLRRSAIEAGIEALSYPPARQRR